MRLIRQTKRLVRRALPRWVCIDRLRGDAGRSVLLTFDDGPHPETTPAVLDVLTKHDARAVFFVVGRRIERAPSLLDAVLERGHFIGNHSFAHPLDSHMGFSSYLEDLRQCQDEISRVSRARVVLHRPPLGRLSIASTLAPKRLGLSTLLWSCSSEDWRLPHESDPLKVAFERASTLAAEVKPRDIVLFHDENNLTVKLLERLLPELRARGFNLAPELEQIV